MLGLSLSVDGPNADLNSGAADAVAGAQRCGFCVAIKSVEGVGSDAGGVLGPAMMRAGGCLMGREGGLRNFREPQRRARYRGAAARSCWTSAASTYGRCRAPSGRCRSPFGIMAPPHLDHLGPECTRRGCRG